MARLLLPSAIAWDGERGCVSGPCMHRFCAGSRLSAPGTAAWSSEVREEEGGGLQRAPSLARSAMVAILGLSLLLAGCASTRIQTAGETQERYWEWCDRVQQNHPTVLCFQQ